MLARERIERHGWQPISRPGHKGGWTLFDAVWDQPVSVARWQAKQLLDRIVRADLAGWDGVPMATRESVDRALIIALARCGLTELAPVRRGGWAVSR